MALDPLWTFVPGFLPDLCPSSVPRTPNSPASTSALLVPPLMNRLHRGCPPGPGPTHSSLSIWATAPLSPPAAASLNLLALPFAGPAIPMDNMSSSLYLWGFRNYQLSRCGHQEQLHPFKGKQLFCLLRHSFLISLPKDNILIPLGKSSLPATPGLGSLEGRQGSAETELLGKCASEALLLQAATHFGRKQGTAPRLQSYLKFSAVQPQENVLMPWNLSFL